MSNISSGAIKVIEIIGISEKSFDDAVNQAVKNHHNPLKELPVLR